MDSRRKLELVLTKEIAKWLPYFSNRTFFLLLLLIRCRWKSIFVVPKQIPYSALVLPPFVNNVLVAMTMSTEPRFCDVGHCA